jgi:hypothetical protein
MESVERKVPSEISKQLNTWDEQARLLRVIHASLGILAMACSFLVASKINSLDSGTIEWLAFFAALSTGLLSGFDLGSKANRMRRAWRLLNAAILMYEANEIEIKNVINAYKEAEKLIGDVKEEPRDA